MEILSTIFGKKRYVVNKKKRRVTAKFNSIELYEHKNVVVAVCRDTSSCPYRQRIYFWDKVTEKALDYGDVDRYTNLGVDMFALRTDELWTIYDLWGYPIRGEISYFTKCKNMDKYIVHIDGKVYFASEKFELLAGPFVSATDFDAYGYAVVQTDYEYFTLLNKEFKQVFEPVNSEQLTPLSKEYIRVRKNGFYGVINLEKKEIIPIIYDRIAWQRHNHFELMYNRKLGLANIKGEVVFECLYDEIMETPDKFVVKDFARIESTKTLESAKN